MVDDIRIPKISKTETVSQGDFDDCLDGLKKITFSLDDICDFTMFDVDEEDKATESLFLDDFVVLARARGYEFFDVDIKLPNGEDGITYGLKPLSIQ